MKLIHVSSNNNTIVSFNKEKLKAIYTYEKYDGCSKEESQEVIVSYLLFFKKKVTVITKPSKTQYKTCAVIDLGANSLHYLKETKEEVLALLENEE